MSKYPPTGIGIVYCVVRDDKGVILGFGIQGIFDDKGRHVSKADAVADVKAGTMLYPLWVKEGAKLLGLKCHVSGSHLAADPNDTICDNLSELPDCDLTQF